MVDDGVVFLRCSGQEAGDVNKGYEGNVEGVAETHEARSLAAGVAIEHAGVNAGLVCHDAHALSVEAGKTHYYVPCEIRVNLKELTVVNNRANHLVHIVCHVGVVGDYVVEHILLAVNRVVAFHPRGFLHVVLRNEAQEAFHDFRSLLLGLGGEMRHAALAAVNRRAAEFL